VSLSQDIARVRAGVDRLRRRQAAQDARYADPCYFMDLLAMEPDAWQRRLLTARAARQPSPFLPPAFLPAEGRGRHRRSGLPSGGRKGGGSRTLLLVTRQGGKSTATAVKALSRAMSREGALVLLLSPSLRQSQELFLKVVEAYRAAGFPHGLRALSALRMEFDQGSRIVALPGTEKTVRGYSGVDVLVVDEAARVDDELYYAIRPMLAVSGGELIALSTPWGKRGWFYEAWTSDEPWERIKVTAYECPRITPEFLEEERRSLPDSWFRSEYLCEFMDTVDQVFRGEDIDRAFSGDVEPLFTGAPVTSAEEAADIERLVA